MAREKLTFDGNQAAAHVSYAFTDVAAIYPITPSSNMAEETDKMAANGIKNIFGSAVKVVEMQSEAGAAGAVHGSLAAGALTTTYTASQGLLLMIPNMYKIAGELLPCVINVSARTVAAHALSIFGDHSDIYSTRQTGFAILGSTNPQEVMDLGAVAHLSTIEGRVPFIHFFDGFRTSHEVQKIEAWDYDDLSDMLNHEAVEDFRNKSLNPEKPMQRGTAQNPDIFFQAREASNSYYDKIPAIVESYMQKVNAKIGTNYNLFDYYGDENAEHVIVAMGSVCDTIEETIDYLRAKGDKVGLIKVRLYRPFSKEHLIKALPKSVKKISVLDRTKEPGAVGEPLYLDIAASLIDSEFKNVPVLSGRYGLSSKDVNPAQIISVYKNSANSENKKRFTIGIVDDVTNLSLPIDENPDTTPDDIFSCKFWGIGSDGTVGANKNTISIIGDNTDMNTQAYFSYDSKKSGGVTVSHLRFGKSKIKSTYLVKKADFVACHNQSYIGKYDIVEDVNPGGCFLLNCEWSGEELDKNLPAKVKRLIAGNNIKFYTIDASKIARELGLGGRVNTILQSAFFKLANIISIDDAIHHMKRYAEKSYSKKGADVVELNFKAIEAGVGGVNAIDVPAEWANATGEMKSCEISGETKTVDYIKNILEPVNAQKGDSLPVSAFTDMVNGEVPVGTSKYEKRAISSEVPCWKSENCIQCNFCAYVCPHAVIRPAALTDDEVKSAPSQMKAVDMNGLPEHKFAMTLSVLDCTGCGSCAHVCPGKKGETALVMEPLENHRNEQEIFEYAVNLPEKPQIFEKFKPTTVKGSQFKTPLLEFSGACAGCGETPYAKLATQLFGDRMYIANATGCSSIWGGSAPATPYTKNKCGKGPAWQNSLFEDNAEFGFGMHLAVSARRERLADLIRTIIDETEDMSLISACQTWLDTMNDGEKSAEASKNLEIALVASTNVLAKKALAMRDMFTKKSIWMVGGDGWAYDIGFGGLDHVVAQGEDVNMLIFDTEVYSNTGGQSSKATPIGAIAQFAAAGKNIKKKDLASIIMSYGYCYVAQIAQGADYNQCIKAFVEAESYPGPAIIIAYSACIAHGIKGGMGQSKSEDKKAVESGYWHLFRYDPRRAVEGLNPFQLDSKEPTKPISDFIKSEVRFSSLIRQNPERAEKLLKIAENDAKVRYEYLKDLAKS